MKKFLPAIVVSGVLSLVLLLAYVVSYAALLQPNVIGPMGGSIKDCQIFPAYRLNWGSVHTFYWPIHKIDRTLRTGFWQTDKMDRVIQSLTEAREERRARQAARLYTP